MDGVAAIYQEQSPGVSRAHDQPINGTKSSVCSPCLGVVVGIARFIKDELGKVGARTELAVLRTLEGRTIRRFRGRIRIKWSGSIQARVMDGDPLRRKRLVVGVQIHHILRKNG